MPARSLLGVKESSRVKVSAKMLKQDEVFCGCNVCVDFLNRYHDLLQRVCFIYYVIYIIICIVYTYRIVLTFPKLRRRWRVGVPITYRAEAASSALSEPLTLIFEAERGAGRAVKISESEW